MTFSDTHALPLTVAYHYCFLGGDFEIVASGFVSTNKEQECLVLCSLDSEKVLTLSWCGLTPTSMDPLTYDSPVVH